MTTRSVTFAVAGVWVLGLGLLAVIRIQSRVPVGYLTRDPSTTVEEAWYLGGLSSLGVVGWAAAATVFGFGAVGARTHAGHRALAATLATGSVLTAVLLIDDLFLVHDDILLRAIGSEIPVLAAYALGFAAWLFVHRRQIMASTARVPLGAAATGFVASVVIDRIWDSDGDWRLVTEDGAKFLGIWTWVVFSVVFTLERLEGAGREPGIDR